jgi:hypothetical protein
LLPNTGHTWTEGIATHFIFIYDFIVIEDMWLNVILREKDIWYWKDIGDVTLFFNWYFIYPCSSLTIYRITAVGLAPEISMICLLV